MQDGRVWTDTCYSPIECPLVTVTSPWIVIHRPGYLAGGGFSVRLSMTQAAELSVALDAALGQAKESSHEMPFSGSIELKV